MIGRLRGVVIKKNDGQLLIDVSGVGYVVHCNERVLVTLPAIGEEAVIYTDLQVREDLLQLYGFADEFEREWYWLLISVQGVGSKAAQAILGALGVRALARSLSLGDVKAVQAAPGVGPKLAARICNELKEKSAALMSRALPLDHDEAEVIEFPTPTSGEDNAARVQPAQESGASYEIEAISALVNLGYDRVLVAQTIARLADDAGSFDALVKAALRAMAPKN